MLSTEARDRRIDVGPVSVRVLEAGEGDVVLLLHGGVPGSAAYAGSAELWRPWIDDLARGNSVLAPDLPGCGGTRGESDEHLTITGSAELLLQMLSQLNVGAVHVVAHGESALVALKLARSSAVVSSCTLLAGHQVAPTNEAVLNLTSAHPPVLAAPAARQGWALDRLSYSSHHITPELLQVPSGARDSVDGLPEAWRPGSGFDGRRRGDIARAKAELYDFCRESSFDVPLALVWAAEDPSTSVEYGYEIMRILARSAAALEFHVMNRVGHFMFREDPAALTRLLRSVWQAAPARALGVPVNS
jgi:2-hydroxy-6-oxonona-2,4-dienedioate hydrolase